MSESPDRRKVIRKNRHETEEERPNYSSNLDWTEDEIQAAGLGPVMQTERVVAKSQEKADEGDTADSEPDSLQAATEKALDDGHEDWAFGTKRKARERVAKMEKAREAVENGVTTDDVAKGRDQWGWIDWAEAERDHKRKQLSTNALLREISDKLDALNRGGGNVSKASLQNLDADVEFTEEELSVIAEAASGIDAEGETDTDSEDGDKGELAFEDHAACVLALSDEVDDPGAICDVIMDHPEAAEYDLEDPDELAQFMDDVQADEEDKTAEKGEQVVLTKQEAQAKAVESWAASELGLDPDAWAKVKSSF